MKVEFLGGVRTVTGSATLLEKGSLKWLVDCGMFQGGKELDERNRVGAHIYTLGGFSAHADQKGLLGWLSHFKNRALEVFVNHGEEKISMELGQLIHQQFHFRTTIPQWREKRLLFAPKEIEMQEGVTPEKIMLEEGKQEILPSVETLASLFKHLDRSYKRLRRKLKNMKGKGKEIQAPGWTKRLEEINKKMEELESEL